MTSPFNPQSYVNKLIMLEEEEDKELKVREIEKMHLATTEEQWSTVIDLYREYYRNEDNKQEDEGMFEL